MEETFAHFVLEKEQLEAIGLFAVHAAYIDSYLERLLCGISEVDQEIGKILLDRPMIDRSCDMLKRIGKIQIKDERLKERFLGIVSEIKAENQERNVAIHGIWMPEREKGKTGAVATKGEKKMNAEKVRERALNLARLHEELHQTAGKISDTLAWLSKYPG